MKNNEKKSELLNLLIVYAIDLIIMLTLSVVFTQVDVALPMMAKSALIYLLLFVPVIVYAVKKGDFTAAAFGLRKIKVSTFFFAILCTIVSCPMAFFANALSQLFVPNVMIQKVDTLVEGSVILSYISVAVLAPVCEEIVCRGFFQNRLKNTLPFMGSAIVSGIMFGALHLNLNQFCYAFVLGVIFAYINRASGSIFTSMIMHFLFNSVNVGILILANMAAKSVGADLGEMAESSRADSQVMLFVVVFYGVLAFISFFLTRKVIRAIAKREGNLEIDAEEIGNAVAQKA